MKAPQTVRLCVVVMFLFAAFNVHAFFDPSVGRWASRDPIEESGGKSLYAYVLNDPILYIDQFGLCACYCKSVEIAFEPGGKTFEWGITKDLKTGKAPFKLGNNIKASWTVQGDPKFCDIGQDETAMSIISGFNTDGSNDFGSGSTKDGKDEAISKDKVSDEGAYVDRLGVSLAEIGFYYAKVKGKIVFKCTGSDNKKITKTLTLDASAIAVVPEAPKDPFVKAQKVITFKLE